VAVNGIYASIIPSYKYNLVLKSFSYGTQVMGHPVHNLKNRVFPHVLSDYKENPRPTFFVNSLENSTISILYVRKI
jgi:hypothetical protein